jgi:hypothetical protein
MGLFGALAFHWLGGGVLRVRYFTIPAVFFVSWIARIHIPAIFITRSLDPTTAFYYTVSICSVLLTVPIGIAVVNLVFAFSTREVYAFYHRPMASARWRTWNSIELAVLVLGAVGLTIYYLQYTPTLALFTLFSKEGSALEITLAREASFKLLEGRIVYLFAWLRNTIWPFLILLAFTMFYTHRTRGWLTLFAFTLLFGGFYASLSTARGPLAMIVFELVLILYALRKGRFGLWTYGGAFVAVFSFPVLVTMLRSSGGWAMSFQRLMDLLYSVVIRRVFIVPADVLSSYFEVFPSVHPRLGGASLSIAGLFGMETFNAANYIAMYRGSTIESALSNAAFIGNAWADFGMTGVVVSGFLLGVFLQATSLWVIRRTKTAASYVLLVLFSGVAFGMVSRPLPTSIVTHGGLAATAVFLVFKFGSTLLRDVATPTQG